MTKTTYESQDRPMALHYIIIIIIQELIILAHFQQFLQREHFNKKDKLDTYTEHDRVKSVGPIYTIDVVT
jgi:hypothetical protein